jgi:hypothetical protein
VDDAGRAAAAAGLAAGLRGGLDHRGIRDGGLAAAARPCRQRGSCAGAPAQRQQACTAAADGEMVVLQRGI